VREFTRELIAICRTFGMFERDAVCCGQVTVAQCLALQQLLAEPRDIASLAESSGVTSSATTRLVDGLEKSGWVGRSRAGDDRRRIEVSLTPAGRELAERLRAQTELTVSAVVARIPRAKRGQVLDSLRLVREALAQSRQELVACCQPSPSRR
jgi:MarR family transcriptional regulator, 2-MHQ and catechol-resistance regulon repressor